MGSNSEELEILHAGIPAWMERPLYKWIDDIAKAVGGSDSASRVKLAAEYDMRRRLNSPLAADAYSVYFSTVLRERADAELTLSFVDFLIAKLEPYREGYRAAEALEAILMQSGSAWRVGERSQCAGLEHRVQGSVLDGVEYTISQGGLAGQRLSEAWHAAYGISPDADKAYKLAIVAVEEAMLHLVTPNDKQGTLGKATTAMFQQQDWSLPLVDDPKKPAADVAYKLCRALLNGEEGRHGGNGYRKPTQEEAEAAVMIAVPLVHWFISGAVARR